MARHNLCAQCDYSVIVISVPFLIHLDIRNLLKCNDASTAKQLLRLLRDFGAL
jgi:hypothetical protein